MPIIYTKSALKKIKKDDLVEFYLNQQQKLQETATTANEGIEELYASRTEVAKLIGMIPILREENEKMQLLEKDKAALIVENVELGEENKNLKEELQQLKDELENTRDCSWDYYAELIKLRKHRDTTYSKEHGWMNEIAGKMYTKKDIENEELTEENEKLKQFALAVHNFAYGSKWNDQDIVSAMDFDAIIEKMKTDEKELKEENYNWEADDQTLTKIISMINSLDEDYSVNGVDDIYECVKNLTEEKKELQDYRTIIAELGEYVEYIDKNACDVYNKLTEKYLNEFDPAFAQEDGLTMEEKNAIVAELRSN